MFDENKIKDMLENLKVREALIFSIEGELKEITGNISNIIIVKKITNNKYEIKEEGLYKLYSGDTRVFYLKEILEELEDISRWNLLKLKYQLVITEIV
jgi:hypothetical protein